MFSPRPFRFHVALVCVVLAARLPLLAQNWSMSNGSGAGCGGVMYDSGGEGASGYQNNENYVFTLCPDVPGNVVYLTFFNFNLDVTGPGVDVLTIYDGDNTGAGTLGTYAGTQLQNVSVSGTVFNTSGCLTLEFHSNGSGTGVFAAGYQCTTPCEHPLAAAVMSEPRPALVCQDEAVTFNGSASTAASGFTIAQYLWDFDDGSMDSTSGPVVAHAYAVPGEYVVQLTITDDNDCESLNLVDQQVRVSTTPNFAQTSPSVETCFGETVHLHGHAEPRTWVDLPDANFGDGVFLPDDVGLPFTSELTFEQFSPGQQITSTNDILSVCVDMEHTFMGDLVLQVICPNGQTTILHQQGGGGTYIGGANDTDNDANPVVGECWHYCWSPTATNGTWIENLGNTTVAGTPPSNAIDPGTYEAVQPFSNLIGCPLNGTWTFQSSDLWAIDNGFICSWEIDFDPSLFPDLTQFTPSIGPGADSSLWAGGTTPDVLSANGDTLSFTAAAAGVYDFIYTVTDDFGCVYDTTIQVTIQDPFNVDAGADAVLCSDPVQLNAAIEGAATDCVWRLHLEDSFGDGWNGSDITVTLNGVATVYTIGNGSVNNVNIPVSPGDVLTLTYAPGTFENEVSYLLRDDQGNVVFSDGPNPQTGPAWSGTTTCDGMPGMVWNWSPPEGLSDPTVPDPSVQVTDPATYTVTAHIIGHPDCRASDVVEILLDPAADPGTDSLLIICPFHPAFVLNDALGGSPVPGGAWTDEGGTAITGTFDPQTDAAGVFTYTVTSALGCIRTSHVEVQVLNADDPQCCPTIDPGTDGSVVACASDGAIALFAQLGGTPAATGAWTAPDGSASDGFFQPGISLPGDYRYSVASGPFCPVASAIVSVVVVDPVDAGTDGAVALCSSTTDADLFTALGGSPQAGGTWTDPAGNAHTGTFTVGADAVGAYTYALVAPAPCPAAQAQVLVSVVQGADAGTDGTMAICANGMALELVNALGGSPQPFGTWTDPSGLPNVGLFDPAVDAPGAYTYTLTPPAPCPPVSAVVQVTVVAPPDAGQDGAALLCTTNAPLDLFTALGGTPRSGGAWTLDGAMHSNLFDPATEAAGTLRYTVTGDAPCPDASAQVVVQVNTPPDAGADAQIARCSTDAPVDLFTLLGGSADASGTWSGPSVLTDGLFDPAAMQPGAYTYFVSAQAPCPDASSVVLVVVATPPDAGNDAPLALCTTSPPADLFAALGGSPENNGTWTGPNTAAHTAVFDPAVDASGPYHYTVAGTAPCLADMATVDVVVLSNPDPGLPGAITLCTSDASIGLFDRLEGIPDVGGTWSGPSAMVGDVFDPGSMSAGIYTYRIEVPPPCVSVSSTVTVAVVQPPWPGVDGALTRCTTASATDLFAQLGGAPGPGGAWTAPDGLPHDAAFDPASDAAGVYTYTLAGTAPCPAATAQVLVELTTPPDAGADNATLLCATGTALELQTLLSGADAGGSWSAPDGTTFGGVFQPGLHDPGNYVYTVPGATPCPADGAVFAITVQAEPFAGTDGALTLCALPGAHDLFALLGAGADATGSWTAPDGSLSDGHMDPAVQLAGTYRYVVIAPPPCTNDTAVVIVGVVQPPQAGEDGSLVFCADGAPASLFAALQGDPDAGGAWSGPTGPIGSDVVDPLSDPAGTYSYTVAGIAPCPAAQSAVQVAIGTPVQAVVVVSDAVCHGVCDGAATVQVTGGVPGYTYAWSNGIAGPADTVATELCAGQHSVSIVDAGGCTGAAAFVVNDRPPLVIDAVSAVDETCVGRCDGTITVHDPEGVRFSVDGGATWQQTAVLQDLCAGQIVVTMQDAFGCTADAMAAVGSPEPVIAAFSTDPDTVTIARPGVVFLNTSSNALNYHWDFGGLGTSQAVHPSFVFPDDAPGTYAVCLIAQDANGCTDSTCRDIVVLDLVLVFIPNAFTPEGDGINEGFLPVFNIPEAVADYTLRVFDRWGEVVFSTSAVDEPWNGSVHGRGGDAMKQDVYVWRIDFRDTRSNERHEQVGSVTLLR